MLEAQTEDGKPAWVNPRKVVVEDLTEGTCHKPSAERIRPEACVRLSQAMTASGAGLSLDSLVEEWYRNDFVRVLMRFGTAPFNLNNEIRTWNYATGTTRLSAPSGTLFSWPLSSASARYQESLDRNHRWLVL